MRERGLECVDQFTDSHGDELVARRGWDDNLAGALAEVSRQSHIMKFTPRDIHERLTDIESGNRWFDNPEKKPEVYTMWMGKTATSLAGIVWFSHQKRVEASNCEYTSGFRLYDRAVGRGLARKFSEIAHSDMSSSNPGLGVWLETDEDNIPARRLYDSLGYKQVANNDGRLVMAWKQTSVT